MQHSIYSEGDHIRAGELVALVRNDPAAVLHLTKPQETLLLARQEGRTPEPKKKHYH